MENVHQCKKKFVTIGYRKHFKIQSLFNGKNPKENLNKYIFFNKHVKIARLTPLLDLYFCNQETVMNS